MRARRALVDRVVSGRPSASRRFVRSVGRLASAQARRDCDADESRADEQERAWFGHRIRRALWHCCGGGEQRRREDKGESEEQPHGRPQEMLDEVEASRAERSRERSRTLPRLDDSASPSVRSKPRISTRTRHATWRKRCPCARLHRAYCASRLVSGRPPAASAAGGKSGLPRAGWWVTPTVRKDRESATENKPPDGPRKRATARVKRRGKSSPRSGRPERHGKPHPEEDRIGGSRGPRCGPRVGRWRPSARTALEKWSSPPTRRHQNPAYGDQALLHCAAGGGRRRRPSR